MNSRIIYPTDDSDLSIIVSVEIMNKDKYPKG
jgi:hypothetical protein